MVLRMFEGSTAEIVGIVFDTFSDLVDVINWRKCMSIGCVSYVSQSCVSIITLASAKEMSYDFLLSYRLLAQASSPFSEIVSTLGTKKKLLSRATLGKENWLS